VNKDSASPYRGNLKLTGTSSTLGGSYDKVRIVGDAVVSGGIACSEMRCIGTYDIKGSLGAGSIRLVGDGVSEALRAGTVKLTGKAIVGRDAEIGELSGAGDVEVGGTLKAGDISLRGSLRVAGDCGAEQFRPKGMFAIGGLLNAGDIDIKLYQNSSAKEIGGGRIEVARGSVISPLSLVFRPSSDAVLEASIIEGDDIHLEHTRAGIVRGSRITIGEGCDIGQVEYKERLDVKRGATVGEQRKV